MSDPAEAIVLVHGLWMHGRVFALQRHRLVALGYRTGCFSYPSVSRGLSANANALAGFVGATEADRIHLVGHSLGGLVVLDMLVRHRDPRLGRVVLMGAPCSGSNSAGVLLRIPGLAAIVGRSLRDWLAMPPPELPAGIEIGVIAGTRGLGFGRLLPGLAQPNDGMVAVGETQLPQASDAITLPVGHSEMLFSRSCLEQALAFLVNGQFKRKLD
jgi:pimeloyl-ACP methyl ester carboxylesterase